MWARPHYQGEEGDQQWDKFLTYLDRRPPDASYWLGVMGRD